MKTERPAHREGVRVACCLPAVAGLPGLTYFREQLVEELGGLHLVELPDTNAEELVGQIIGLLLVQVVFVDQAQDKSALATGAVPAFSTTVAIAGPGMTLGLMVAAVPIAGIAVTDGVRRPVTVVALLAHGINAEELPGTKPTCWIFVGAVLRNGNHCNQP